MRLLIASGIYPPDIGGPATYSQLIAREFAKKGIDVSLICYSDSKEEPEDKNENFKLVKILRKQNVLLRYFYYFWNLFKLARNCDVIYAQGPLSAGLPAMWAKKILNKKFIIKIVGDYAWEQGVNQFGVKDLIEEFQNKKYSKKVERIRKIQIKVVKSADKVIVPSEFLKRIVKGWGVNENKIFVIYNSVSVIEDIKNDLKIAGDIIISGGRLEPWKGMDLLIKIMPDLLKENPDFKLIIVGYGPEKIGLEKLVLTLKLNDKIQLINRLPHKELLEYFKASKVFVLNTGYEGFSHFLIEAMACGLPIITTNVCGNPEIIKDNYNGLLVEYNNKEQIKNAILKIWHDKELQEKLINNGKKSAEQFSVEKMINETIKVLSI